MSAAQGGANSHTTWMDVTRPLVSDSVRWPVRDKRAPLVGALQRDRQRLQTLPEDNSVIRFDRKEQSRPAGSVEVHPRFARHELHTAPVRLGSIFSPSRIVRPSLG